jgi:NitT/TauT family transport system substrate-binding protein
MARPANRRLNRFGICLALVTIPAAGIFAGCRSGTAPDGPAESNRIKIAYLGLTCEAAIFVAHEKGFFKDEGLDVELVKTDWDGLRDGLGLGRFDANYTLIMYLLKPIEQGLDVKITGGVHSGCLRVQAGLKSSIKSVEDLRGKRIGVPTNLGSPPFLFASRVLAAHGMNPNKDVEWVVLPPDVLGLAIDNGQVDAVTNSEPIGSILTAQGKVRTIADQAVDPPYSDEYCCAVVVSGALAKRSPAAAAKVTCAMLKGASWVDRNPTAAAALSVEKRYIAASPEVNAHAISKLKYAPGIARCRSSLDLAAAEMKKAGLLKASTDPAELAKRAWLDLDGVSDQWIKGLKIERVAGGGPPPRLDDRALVALLAGQVVSCCNGK